MSEFKSDKLYSHLLDVMQKYIFYTVNKNLMIGALLLLTLSTRRIQFINCLTLSTKI